jgi:regulator of protease activity HflC (stomatin/prohibitin superfamily)
MFPILDLLIVGLVVIALSGLRVAQEYERGVVFRLGRYKALRGPGLYWIIPLNIERAVRVDIRTRTDSLNDYLQRQASSRSLPDNKS